MPVAARIPQSIPEPFQTALAVACGGWLSLLGEDLVSLVLFGSVARGSARVDSDLDLLVVARGFPRSLRDRRRPLIDLWQALRSRQELISVQWNLVTKTPEEARGHSPLYLDMVLDAVLLYDREGFFATVLSEMRARMQTLGSRRVVLGDGSWYWDLKPDFRFGEIVEL